MNTSLTRLATFLATAVTVIMVIFGVLLLMSAPDAATFFMVLCVCVISVVLIWIIAGVLTVMDAQAKSIERIANAIAPESDESEASED